MSSAPIGPPASSVRPVNALFPLRLPMAVLAATVLFAALLLYLSGRFAGSMEDTHSEIERGVNDVRIRLLRMHNREANMRADSEAYQELAQHGLLGPERRLEWVRVMSALPQASGLTRSDYQISPQRPFARFASDEGHELKLSARRISLQISAVHEGRLLSFLNRLEASTPGLLLLRSCDFDSNAGTTDDVHAHCKLDWITLDP